MHLTCRSVPQCWRWLMIASRQTAVLPVFWSPMISSRWPRPMLVIASIALMPVSSGSLTGWRSTTDGACSSRALVVSAWMSPLSSSGRPSGSTTRPRKPSPTGTDSTRPVCLTSSPSSMPEASPKTTQPISRTSRLRAMPSRPPRNSSSSRAMVEGIPSTRAMPSPVSTTRPTSSRVTVGRNDSTWRFSAAAISSGLMLSSVTVVPFLPRSRARGGPCSIGGLRCAPPPEPHALREASANHPPSVPSGDAELFAGLLEAAADAAVEHLVADADDHRAQNSLVDGDPQVDLPAGDAAEDLREAGPALLVQFDGGAHLGDHPVAAPGRQLGQLPGRNIQVAAFLQDRKSTRLN